MFSQDSNTGLEKLRDNGDCPTGPLLCECEVTARSHFLANSSQITPIFIVTATGTSLGFNPGFSLAVVLKGLVLAVANHLEDLFAMA